MSKTMLLMEKDTPIMKFNMDDGLYEVIEPNLMPYRLRGTIKEFVPQKYDDSMDVKDIEKIIKRNAEVQAKITSDNRNYFINYLASRVLHLSKSNYKKIMNTLGYSQEQTEQARAAIAISCRILSMTDNYWIKTENSETKWEDVNLKKVSLSEAVMLLALHGKSFTIQGRPHTPELTNLGSYATAWKRENNDNYLYKKSSKGGHESKEEICVSNILDCFNVPHAIYEPAQDEYDSDMCKSKNISSEELTMANATDIMLYAKRTMGDEMKFVLDIDSESIYKMCIVDYLISNSDRHSGNWGFYVNSGTGNILSCHPLFDHNNAFDEGDMEAIDGGPSKIFEGKSKKEAAEYAIKNCDFQCISPVTKDMFYNDKEYISFMKRAVSLGLYQKNKPTFWQKVGLKEYEEYIPVKLSPEAKIDYDKYYKDLYEKNLQDSGSQLNNGDTFSGKSFNNKRNTALNGYGINGVNCPNISNNVQTLK